MNSRLERHRVEDLPRPSFRSGKAAIFAGGLALLLMAAPAVTAQSDSDAALLKKHEKITGRYEFDFSALGGEVTEIEIVVRQGALWVDDGDGRPAEIKPVNESALEFAGADAVNGPVQVTFIKDDSGTVVKCRLVMPDLGLDVTGIKLK